MPAVRVFVQQCYARNVSHATLERDGFHRVNGFGRSSELSALKLTLEWQRNERMVGEVEAFAIKSACNMVGLCIRSLESVRLR